MATLTEPLPASPPDPLMTIAARKVAALGVTGDYVRRAGVLYYPGGFPSFADAVDKVLAAEPWVSPSSCSECWPQHQTGSGRCTHWCHYRDAATKAA